MTARPRIFFALSALAVLGGMLACGSDPNANADDAGKVDLGDSASLVDSGTPENKPIPDAGYPYDGGSVRADRFATGVVAGSFVPGDCAGFGISGMPGVVEGPPIGGGTDNGSLDVVSLGNGGSIVLSFGSNAIIDGPGADFLVFENPFLVSGGDPTSVFAEPGEVSVSDDGTTWKTFPCTATKYPYGMCAGWHPVFSSPANGISPVDPAVAGGDPFDLKDIGITHARFVRIRDVSHETCPPQPNKVNTNGFDLDGIAIVNAETP